MLIKLSGEENLILADFDSPGIFYILVAIRSISKLQAQKYGSGISRGTFTSIA
jgi:hypothetical protein